MSGIAGCLALAEGTRPDTDWTVRAARRMAHRGPDDDGVFADGAIALAARRLAVIDPSAAGHQPMRSSDGRFWMVYNGEIYNHGELAQRLRARGVQLRGKSDSEVLLEMFAAEGKDALRRLRGMYAFAIWDTRNQELFCARDPFGIKPLYYTLAEGGNQLRFASERKALLGAGEVSVIDPDALRRYLSFQYVPRSGDDDAAGAVAAARALHGRPARRACRRVPLLAPGAAPGQVAGRRHTGTDTRRAARVRHHPPAQRRPAWRLPVRRRGLGGDLRAGRREPAWHARRSPRGSRAPGTARSSRRRRPRRRSGSSPCLT